MPGVRGETVLAGGATTTPGKLYTVFHSSIPNQNGVVRACPTGQLTVSAMLTALGYGGGTAAVTNIGARISGVHASGIYDDGKDAFD